MIVALETHIRCPACSHPVRFIAVTTVRVNKKSLRVTPGGDVMLGALEDWRCPECCEEIPRDRPLDREPYRLSEEDAVKVAEYRRNKWGIEGDGASVEKVAG
jgi:hypothetical protein